MYRRVVVVGRLMLYCKFSEECASKSISKINHRSIYSAKMWTKIWWHGFRTHCVVFCIWERCRVFLSFIRSWCLKKNSNCWVASLCKEM